MNGGVPVAGMEARLGLTAQLPLGKVHLAAAAADYLTAPSLYVSACLRMEGKHYKDSGACYIGEGFRGSRTEISRDIPSKVKNKLLYLIIKQDMHIRWVSWILEAVYAKLRIPSQCIYQTARSLTIPNETQRKRELYNRDRFQGKLQC